MGFRREAKRKVAFLGDLFLGPMNLTLKQNMKPSCILADHFASEQFSCLMTGVLSATFFNLGLARRDHVTMGNRDITQH